MEAPEISIKENYASVLVNGLDESLFMDNSAPELLSVYVIEDGKEWEPLNYSIQGNYHFDNHSLIFTPHYPFLENTEYYVRFEADTVLLEHRFVISADTTPVTFVDEVYPTTDLIPRNVLKFYVQFSGSMMEGNMLDHVHIVDSDGLRMEHVFLEIPQELWDTESKRLTILFDPARIKRGMDALDEYGAPFKVGQSYSLIIDKDWKDGGDRVLTEPYQKNFTIVEDDRVKLDSEKWEITAPSANSNQKLEINFFETMDYGLLNRVIHIKDKNGILINGDIALEEDQTKWVFTPEEHWNEEEYTIYVESILEDMAGNNLLMLFDVDLKNDSHDEEKEQIEPFVKIPFIPIKK